MPLRRRSAAHATHLLKRTALAQGIHAMLNKPVLHGDNGATLKATTVLAMLNWLGVRASYSRPRVSDDNAFVESLFRTAKYRPEFPERGFADLNAARTRATGFVHWYNLEHRHSGIRYVTPAQRHAGQDREILRARHQVYTQARQNNPRRWSGATRNWSHIATVTLNPERTEVVTAAVAPGNSLAVSRPKRNTLVNEQKLGVALAKPASCMTLSTRIAMVELAFIGGNSTAC